MERHSFSSKNAPRTGLGGGEYGGERGLMMDDSEPASPTSLFDIPDHPTRGPNVGHVFAGGNTSPDPLRHPSPVPPLQLAKAVGVMIQDQLDSS
eukprot:EW704697.1.p2 GENE.EW704697.1~~EW704697.1.p2  ORF type:complete len:106 (+),score=14.33 EW704697.1:38-319(+)